MSDKYALICENKVLKLITYRIEDAVVDDEENDGPELEAKTVYQKHLDEIGENYQAFVDPEISQGIILSVKKENILYLYSIEENGKLALIELPENATINNALVYTFEKKTEESENESEWTIEFKKYEIGR